MICLCLTSSSLSKNYKTILQYKKHIDCVELRIDLLSASEQKIDTICKWVSSHITIPIIATIRKPYDGGAWSQSEAIRQKLLSDIITSSLFSYVDVEGNLPSLIKKLYSLSTKGSSPPKTKIIISRHWFTPIKNTTWLQTVHKYAKLYPHAIIKIALMCKSTTHMCNALEACNSLLKEKKIHPHIKTRFVFVAMGEYGRPLRILAKRTGTLWTYASDEQSPLLALGHFDPKTLHILYRYKEITQKTLIFAIVGNPVSHSQSPLFHNKEFIKKKQNAIYIPLPIDKCSELLRAIRLLSLRGISVTIPHKKSVIPFLHWKDKNVLTCASCNTIIHYRKKLYGYNTDIKGFLTPLKKRIQKNRLKGIKCTIIGCGGTAQAISHALLQEGIHLLITNRTLAKAEKLVATLKLLYKDRKISSASLYDYSAIQKYDTILIQTSSVGMNNATSSPLPSYPFCGKELVYDVIYTPPITRFLSDAQNAGCTIISGKEMFKEQAKYQSQLFFQSIHKTN